MGAALAGAALLYLPPEVLERIGLTALVEAYRPHIGGVLVVSLALLVAQAFFALVTLAKKILADKRAKSKADELIRRKHEYLEKLTPSEKSYLAPYIHEQENTQYFSIDDGVVGGLTGKGILYRASNVSTDWKNFAYNLQPWARELLEKNPRWLD